MCTEFEIDKGSLFGLFCMGQMAADPCYCLISADGLPRYPSFMDLTTNTFVNDSVWNWKTRQALLCLNLFWRAQNSSFSKPKHQMTLIRDKTFHFGLQSLTNCWSWHGTLIFSTKWPLCSALHLPTLFDQLSNSWILLNWRRGRLNFRTCYLFFSERNLRNFFRVNTIITRKSW